MATSPNQRPHAAQPAPRRNPAAAVTLVEVLIAAGLIGICVTGIVASLLHCHSVAVESRTYTAAKSALRQAADYFQTCDQGDPIFGPTTADTNIDDSDFTTAGLPATWDTDAGTAGVQVDLYTDQALGQPLIRGTLSRRVQILDERVGTRLYGAVLRIEYALRTTHSGGAMRIDLATNRATP